MLIVSHAQNSDCRGTRTGGVGPPDLTFFGSAPGQGWGGGGAPGQQRAGLATHEAGWHRSGFLSPGRSLSPDPSPALEPKAEKHTLPRDYRDRHLVRPPLEAGPETGAGRAGWAGRAGRSQGWGAGGKPAVQPFLRRGGAHAQRLLPVSVSITRSTRNACGFPT